MYSCYALFTRISMRATYPAYFILRDMITLIIFCEAPYYEIFCVFQLLLPS